MQLGFLHKCLTNCLQVKFEKENSGTGTETVQEVSILTFKILCQMIRESMFLPFEIFFVECISKPKDHEC